MQHLYHITNQLGAIVGDDADRPGAHTAVLVCDHSTDVWAYATRSRHQPSVHRIDAMAAATGECLTPEEYAYRLAAVAMTAWRHRRAKLARTGGATGTAARYGRSPHRFADTHSLQDNTSLSEAIRTSARASSTRQATLTASDNDDRSDIDSDDSEGPMLVECDDGRLLIYPMPSRKVGRDDLRRPQRLRLLPPSQQASRRSSFARRSRSLSGDAAPAKSTLTQLRSTAADDHGDTAWSTEDETDRDSLRSDSATKIDSLSPLLLVLNADTTAWYTLLQQARTFAELCSTISSS
ncbi:Uncharacterized protein MSYG_1765 [Malassezia sympodialis ATCC 42132]|uniref:Uncharacterized protein n=1 Tax=Malassezia sympodialis (strain ATCC 42132) TaxID=1230383 RepID=A0A1M8A4R6_MALS4|nr:Uncharacterized protein MSYG_1765 [Malassezia sympodialis ATCC 42132]